MQLTSHFAGRRPVLLVVMDGWGMGKGGPEDAISQANTPVFDRLWAKYPHTCLMAHGHSVGLPSRHDLGGSEVGHLTMGAGQILDQGSTRINKAIQDRSFFEAQALRQIVQAGKNGGTLHLLGLLSDGNIHSHIDHFLALINHAFEEGIKRLRVHALLDGRDVGIQSAQKHIARLEQAFAYVNNSAGFDYCFASGGGRELITMDRDRSWDKVKAGWDIHVHGESKNRFANMLDAIKHFRAETPEIVDQDIPGFIIVDDEDVPLGRIEDGDAVIMVNFRGDRALEISEAFCLDDFDGFDRGRCPDVTYAGMMVYDEDRDLPKLQIMGPTKVANPFGRRIFNMGIHQFRLAETQKYAHVTFFFNGGYREPLDAKMEDYILIPSDKGVSFSDKPEMKAAEVADKAVELIESGKYGFGLINFANTDMVGHCGHIEPAIRAAEAVDKALGKIVATLEKAGGSAIITADHGNAEEMHIETTKGHESSTKHSLNPVPCIVFDTKFDGSYRLKQPKNKKTSSDLPGLANLAATLFLMLGEPVPEDIESPLIINAPR